MKTVIFMLMVFLVSCSVSTKDYERLVRYDDPGGKIYQYVGIVKAIKRDETPVELKGYCASACTIFLHLPYEQICIHPETRLLFHAAYGGSESQNRWSTLYVFALYPKWVQDWIKANGGLTPLTITMPYSYSKQHMRTC